MQDQNKEILEQNNLIIRQQNSILVRIEVLEQGPRQPNEPPPPELPRLPLETMREFEEVEGSLQSAPLRVALVSIFLAYLCENYAAFWIQ